MTNQRHIPCSKCGFNLPQGVPFCPECGMLPPSIVSKGPLALELGDVPAQNTRTELLQLLKAWFPDLDSVNAEKLLKTGPTVLMTGIDEESGTRILTLMQNLKVPARLVDHRADSWIKRLWNSGLVVSIISLLLAAIFRGPVGFLLILIAGGAPLAASLLIGRKRKPLFGQVEPTIFADQWIGLSHDYSLIIQHLAPADGAVLKSLAAKVFDFQSRLRTQSLASVAAGAETGELYKRLRDAVMVGIEISRNVISTTGDAQESSRKELIAFKNQISKIDDWYHSVEQEGNKETNTTQLVVDLSDIVERIDKIVHEVRPSLASGFPEQTDAQQSEILRLQSEGHRRTL